MDSILRLLYLIFIIACSQAFVDSGLDSVVGTAGSLIGLIPFRMPDSESNNKHR